MSVREQAQVNFTFGRDERQWVFTAAAVVVEMASRSGAILRVDAEARQLFQECVDCPLTIDDLRDVIALIAIRQRVPIQFG